MKTWLAMILVVPGLAMAAGERIVVMSPRGAPAVRAQLQETLCLSEDCVATDKVVTAGKLDWKKIARERVTSVVQGQASVVKHKAEVDLQVMNASGKVRLTQRVPLEDSGKLAVKDLVTASADVLGAIDSPAKTPAKAARAAPTRLARAHAAHLKASHKLASRGHALHARG